MNERMKVEMLRNKIVKLNFKGKLNEKLRESKTEQNEGNAM